MSQDIDLSKLVLGGFDTRTRLHRLETAATWCEARRRKPWPSRSSWSSATRGAAYVAAPSTPHRGRGWARWLTS